MEKHILIPEHRKLTKEQAEEILNEYNISKKQLPRISIQDPAILDFGCEMGDLIEITRNSEISGKIKFYRMVTK